SNRDHLSQLPSELLDDIFHYAHDSCQPLTTPISKTLLPFQRRQLFRSITISSYTSFKNLCEIAQRPSNIPSYVRHLEFVIPFKKARARTVTEVEDPGSPSKTVIEQFLQQSSSIQTIVIKGSTRIALIFLASPIVAASLPKLTSLEIASTLHSVPDPFDPINYARLQSFPRLDMLTLHIFRTLEEIVSKPQPQPPSKPLRLSARLHLSGPLTSSASSIRQFLLLFDSITLLSLYDTSEALSLIYDLLDAVPAPEKVRVLALRCPYQRSLHVKGAFLKHIKAFTSLKCLVLLSNLASIDPSLYSDLQTLPITTLGLEATAKVSLFQLHSLIDGPTKHPTLRTIFLNHIRGKIGTRIEDAGKPYYDAEDEVWDVHQDWVLPEWTEELSEEGLVGFIEVAKQAGVTVGGSAVEAIGIMAQFDKEWELLEEYELEDEEEEEESE
ncbi:hypothetical protein JCM5353_006457, partial [Sporobolomyces roseus]